MPKRKRHDLDYIDEPNGKSLEAPIDSSVVEQPAPARRSSRLRQTKQKILKEQDKNPQLLSPTGSTSGQHIRAGNKRKGKRRGKRKRSSSRDNAAEAEPDTHTKLRASHHTSESIEPEPCCDPVAYWAAHREWPKNFTQTGRNMNSERSNKRKSESSHRTDRLHRMEQHGIFVKASKLMRKESKDLCKQYLVRDRVPFSYPGYPADRIEDVLNRVENANEPRIQRDVMPIVVPSIENLFFNGEKNFEVYAEDIQAEWIRCAPMGSTRPKPDFTVGLGRTAFSDDEFDKLSRYGSVTTPFLFTPNICFPFLICEAKNGEDGLNKGQRQNLHSGGIAVRAIIELYKAAYGNDDSRVQNLYGQVLIFTVSHNHDVVQIYGHFAALSNAGKVEVYRHPISMCSLTFGDGKDRFEPYNFVYNVYEKFAPGHLKRIKEAAMVLPKANKTWLSQATSDIGLDDASSQQDSQSALSQSQRDMQPPSASASFLRKAAKMEERRQELARQKKIVEELEALVDADDDDEADNES